MRSAPRYLYRSASALLAGYCLFLGLEQLTTRPILAVLIITASTAFLLYASARLFGASLAAAAPEKVLVPEVSASIISKGELHVATKRPR